MISHFKKNFYDSFSEKTLLFSTLFSYFFFISLDNITAPLPQLIQVDVLNISVDTKINLFRAYIKVSNELHR